MTDKNITSVSLEDLDSMEDRTRHDAPEGPSLGAAFWRTARVVYPDGPKERLTVRFDRDIVDWFRAQGRGYQTRMNAVLRAYVDAVRKDRAEP